MAEEVSRSQPAPTAPEPLGRIEAALKRWDDQAGRFQLRFLTFAMFTTALGPVAVLLLATQVLAFPHGGAVAVSLIALELATLMFALAILVLRIGRSHDLWIAARLRAEVLRRETHLFLARVGPYLNLAPGALGARVDQRLLVIDNELRDPVSLLAMEEGEEAWRDRLEDSRTTAAADIPDFPKGLRAYADGRVGYQRGWFAKKRAWHDSRARIFENGAKLILMLAFAVAAYHLGLLAAGKGHDPGALHVALMIVAITLPALGGAFTGLHSISAGHRVSRSYLHHGEALEPLEQSLRRLQARLDSAEPPERELQFRFKRTVLATEELLSGELRQWWLIMHAVTPRAGL